MSHPVLIAGLLTTMICTPLLSTWATNWSVIADKIIRGKRLFLGYMMLNRVFVYSIFIHKVHGFHTHCLSRHNSGYLLNTCIIIFTLYVLNNSVKMKWILLLSLTQIICYLLWQCGVLAASCLLQTVCRCGVWVHLASFQDQHVYKYSNEPLAIWGVIL